MKLSSAWSDLCTYPYWESSRRKRHLDTFTITEVQSRTEDSIHKAYSSK